MTSTMNTFKHTAISLSTEVSTGWFFLLLYCTALSTNISATKKWNEPSFKCRLSSTNTTILCLMRTNDPSICFAWTTRIISNCRKHLVRNTWKLVSSCQDARSSKDSECLRNAWSAFKQLVTQIKPSKWHKYTYPLLALSFSASTVSSLEKWNITSKLGNSPTRNSQGHNAPWEKSTSTRGSMKKLWRHSGKPSPSISIL